MKPTTSKSCSKSSRARRAGLTLIEVVAAIAIMGSVLAAVVLSKSRHTRAVAQTRAQQMAVLAADELIGGWWTRPGGVPLDEEGELDGQAGWRWETRLVDGPDVEALTELGTRVVRVEIHADGGGEEPLLAVDMVLPDPEAEEEEDQEGAEASEPAPGAGEEEAEAEDG